MNRVETAVHYNNLYREKNIYGTQPSPFVRRIPRLMKSGTVLDIGAGQGRNSLYLAGNGFKVTAVDISIDGLEAIQQKTRSWGIAMETQLSDITQIDFANSYDVIICTHVMHHLSPTEARALIQKIKGYTNPNGLNIISAFTKDGEFFRKNPSMNYFFPYTNELKEIYAKKGWGIPRYIEETKTTTELATGRRIPNTSASILVRKI